MEEDIKEIKEKGLVNYLIDHTDNEVDEMVTQIFLSIVQWKNSGLRNPELKK